MGRYDGRFFEGKLVVVTGGSSGIGLALAEALRRHGAKVVIVASDPRGIEDAVERLGGHGPALCGYACDIGSPAAVRATAALIREAHGTPDILVNNAGFATYRTFEQTPCDEVEDLMSVNFAGAIRVTREFIDGMIERRSGQIVNVASIAAALTLTPNGLYCAAKHGMAAWSRCLARETDRFGIAVGVVCPGRVETRFFDHETFRTRLHRRETEVTVPMSDVIEAILETIVNRRALRFVPRYLGVLAWATQAFGPLVQKPLDRMLRARIDDIYREQSHR